MCPCVSFRYAWRVCVCPCVYIELVASLLCAGTCLCVKKSQHLRGNSGSVCNVIPVQIFLSNIYSLDKVSAASLALLGVCLCQFVHPFISPFSSKLYNNWSEANLYSPFLRCFIVFLKPLTLLYPI